jgi:polysaccharide biosynthesis protein PslJ
MTQVQGQFSSLNRQATDGPRAGYDPAITGRGRRRIDACTLLSVYLVLLMLIPATLVFAPLGAAGGPATIFAALLFVVCLVTWLHPAFTLDRGRQPVRIIALIFTCVIVAAYTSANRHAMPVLERNAADRGLIFTLGWLGVTLLAADGIHTMDRLRDLIRRLVLGASAMAVLGMAQFFTGLDAAKYIKIPGLSALSDYSDLLSRGSLNRPSATASHPIEFGAVLVLALPLAINQARFAPPGKRLSRWVQVAVIGGTAPMTVSRSAILGLVLTGLIILPTWPKNERRIAYLAALLGSAAMWVSVHGLVGTITGLFVNIGNDSSTQSRSNAFAAAGVYVSHNPWLGRGLGTFLPQTYFYIDDQYLTSLIETGIIGLIALLAIFATGALTARSGRRLALDPQDRDLGQCLMACMVIAAVSFFTYDALSFSMDSGLTFLVLGCCGVYWRLQRQAGMSAGFAASSAVPA